MGDRGPGGLRPIGRGDRVTEKGDGAVSRVFRELTILWLVLFCASSNVGAAAEPILLRASMVFTCTFWLGSPRERTKADKILSALI